MWEDIDEYERTKDLRCFPTLKCACACVCSRVRPCVCLRTHACVSVRVVPVGFLAGKVGNHLTCVTGSHVSVSPRGTGGEGETKSSF